MTNTMRIVRVALAVAALTLAAAPASPQGSPKQLVEGAMDQGGQPAKKNAKKGTQPAAPEAPAQPPAKKVDLPAPPPNFEYAPQGRRDPFISLVARGDEGRTGEAGKSRAEGVPGIVTAELFVRGIMQTRGAYIAMVSGADKKIYTVRAGDKLADGVIRQITANSIVILQEVNDPLSLEKQREVRKFLRGGNEVK